MKVVFLDIDGVLNSTGFLLEARKKSFFEKDVDEIDPTRVALLNKIVEQTGAVIVISSSWRNILCLADLRELLRRRGFTGKVISQTPSLNFPGRVRGDEIQAFLDERRGWRPVLDFVILDDDSDMGELSFYLVKTDPAVGLTEADVARAVVLLERG